MTYTPPRIRRIPLDSYDAIVWSMDNSGAPISSSGFSLPVSLNGTATFSTTGLFNTSIYFNTNVLASTDSTIEPNPLSFTYSCWAFLKSYGSGSPIIVSKAYHTIGEGWISPLDISISLSSSLDGYWDVGSISGTASLHIDDSSAIVQLESWQHLAFTWDGYWIRAYINGSEVASDHTNMTSVPLAFDFGSHGPWQIGGNSISPGDYIDGYVDDVRISNIARDAKYIEHQYRWGIGEFDDDIDKPFKFFSDFSLLSLGPNSNVSFAERTGLIFSRASGATVQTGRASIDVNATDDEPRIGSIGATWGRGLVFEEARDNWALGSRTIPTNWASSGSGVTYTGGQSSIDGGTNAVRVQLSGNGDTSSFQSTGATLNSPTCYSQWIRSSSIHNEFNVVVGNASSSANAVLTDAFNNWERFSSVAKHNNVSNTIKPVSSEYNSIGAVDITIDFVQVEEGAFATEAIITSGSEVTRAGERLYVSDAGQCIDNGTLNLYYKLIPKGSSSEYITNMRLWTIDGYNYCEIDATTGSLRTVVQGQTWLTDDSLIWNQFDVLEIFVTVGGDVPGRAVYRLNGGAPIQLGNSDTSIPDVLNTGSFDILCDGTNNQFTSWVKFISFWRTGQNPFWATLPPPFFPTSLNNLELWLVSSLGVGLTSGEVSNWDDSSGNSNNFVASNGSVRPLFLSSGINDRPDMVYDGYDTLNGAAGLNPSTGITVFGIFSTSNTEPVLSAIFGKGFTQSNFILELDTNGYSKLVGLGGESGRSDDVLNDGKPHVVVALFDDISQTFRQYVDGVKQLNTGTTIFDLLNVAYPINVGALTDDGFTIHNSFIGNIPEVGLYTRAIVPSEVDSLNKYLLTKAGIKKHFRPDVIGGLQLWFRNDFNTTVDFSNLISVWGDLSTHSRDLVQPNGSAQPLLEFDANSKLVGPFFGGSNYMYWDTADIASNSVVVFATFKSSNIPDLSQIWGKGFSSIEWAFNGHNPFGHGTIDFTINDTNFARCDVKLDDNRPHTLIGTWDNSSQLVSLYVDGYLQYVGSTFVGTLSGTDSVGVGAKVDSTGSTANDFFIGNVLEAGVYNTTLTPSRLSQLSGYLGKRFPNTSRGPFEIDGLNSWFRSTLNVTESGGLVSDWGNLSNANVVPSLHQSNDSLRPIFISSGTNNLPELHGTISQSLVGNSALLGTNAITLFAIFRTIGTTIGTIYGMGYSQNAYKLSVSASGFLTSYITNSGSNVVSDIPLNDGTPHLAIVTWDNSDGYIELYVDGLLQANTTIENGTITGIGDANAIMAGALNDSILVEQFDGYIAEVGSYNRKLTPKEAVALSHYMSYRANITIVEYPTVIANASDMFRADIGTILSGTFTNSVSQFASIVAANIIQLVQGDTAQRPLLIDPGTNSFADMAFDGASALYATTTAIATADPNQLTMYVIFSTTDNGTFTLVGMHGNNPHYSFDISSGILQANVNGQITTSDYTVNDGLAHWAVLRWDAAFVGGAIQLYVDGTNQTSSIGITNTGISDGSGDGDLHSIGAGVTNSGLTASNYFTGTISEHGTFSSRLVGSDLSTLFAYLRTRSGAH